MTREDIIRMAEQAGAVEACEKVLGARPFSLAYEFEICALMRFHELAVAAEREACAVLCETNAVRWVNNNRSYYVAHECANAIRSRGIGGRCSMSVLLIYTLTKTTRRLTFDITYQHPDVTWFGSDDGDYFKFKASNGYEVISRSRMDIQTERLWLLGAKSKDEPRSGSMVFSCNEKRDRAYVGFIQAIDEWAQANGGTAMRIESKSEGVT